MVYYKPGSGQIVCPCHEGYFDAKTGTVNGPPPRPLPSLDVLIKEQSIYVKAHENQVG